MAMAAQTGEYAETVARALWKDDRAVYLTRAAVSPATTTSAPWAGNLSLPDVADLLADLRPQSGAARLFQACLRVDLSGVSTVSVPLPSTNPLPPFVAEGAPIPVGNANYTAATVGPVRKLAIIESFSEELVAYGANAETIVRATMTRAAARQLDTVVFDAVAADSTRPAGLLAGAPVIAPTSGGGLNALVGDIRNTVDAITAAGGGASLMFFASPSRVITMRGIAGDIGFPVVPLATAPVASLIVVDAGGVASAFDGLPEIESGRDMLLHYEATTPLAIGTAGTPPTVAAPTYSHFQMQLIGVRLRVNCAWTKLVNSLVQVVPNVTW